ncbi:YraN family protein [Nocardia sp. IBHARD005]|uniref:YraN family protein n=1 Tax=Nocardia sp. IBHARD005 TaxID=3457765 RepID=UPI004059DE5B
MIESIPILHTGTALPSSFEPTQGGIAHTPNTDPPPVPSVTVFVEVKTRSGLGFGTPAEAVTFSKQQRIRRLALLWLAEQDGPWRRIRFDVVSVLVPQGRGPVIDHLTAAF